MTRRGTVLPSLGRVEIAPALAWLVASLLVTVPILMSDYLPLVDLPAHMARQYIAQHGDGDLSMFYEYRFSFIPNSAVDMLRLLIGAGDIFTFTRVVMAGYAVLTVSSAMIFARVLKGHWQVWPAAAALLSYNAAFYWGFQNFVVTIPVALLAFALWIGLEGRNVWLRALIFLPVAGLIMLMHLFAFIGLAVMVFGYEAQTVISGWRTRGRRAFLDGLVLMLPLIVLSALELHAILTAAPNPNGGETEFGAVGRRLTLFLRMLMPPQFVEQPLLEKSAVINFGAILSLAILAIFGNNRLRFTLDPRLRGAMLVLFLGSLAMPRLLSGVYYSDIRLPLLFLLLWFAGSSWQGFEERSRVWLLWGGAIAILCLLLLQATAYHRFARAYTTDVEDIEQISQNLPVQARVVAVRGGGQMNVALPTLWHVDAYLVPFAHSFVPSMFLGVHNFDVLPEWKASASPQTVIMPHEKLSGCDPRTPRYLRDWTRKYTHVLLVDPVAGLVEQRDRLNPIATAGRFTLFEIKVPDQARAADGGCEERL